MGGCNSTLSDIKSQLNILSNQQEALSFEFSCYISKIKKKLCKIKIFDEGWYFNGTLYTSTRDKELIMDIFRIMNHLTDFQDKRDKELIISLTKRCMRILER